MTKKNNQKKLAVLTSGGDSSGMNACVRATVRYALSLGYQVYGVRQGYLGLINNDIFEMNYKSVSNCVHRGGTILRTARSLEFKQKEVMLKAVENLTNLGIDNLIAIGGDGTFRGAETIHQNTNVNVIGIPGTIDNDLGYTDNTIGFDTACNTVIDAILKLRDTITSHDRIMVLEVMGRNCGQIAMNAAVAGGAEYVIIPEYQVAMEDIVASIKRGYDEKGKTSTIIVLAEGCAHMKDDLIKQVHEATGKMVCYVKLSYMQRGGNPTMVDRVLAARFAVKAVDLLERGQSGRVVGVDGQNVKDMNIIDALDIPKVYDDHLYFIAQMLSK